MISRLSSMVVWGLTAVAAVAWGLRITGQPTPVPAHAALSTPPQAAAGADFSRVLGEPPPEPAPPAEAPLLGDSRFKLMGVVAPRPGRSDGLAVIAVDGQAPRTWRQGREVAPGLVLQQVAHRRVELAAPGQPNVVLELPALAEAQRGQLDGGAAALSNQLPVPPAVAGLAAQGALPPARGMPMPNPPQPEVPAVNNEAPPPAEGQAPQLR